ncbi:hypothetical protein [Alloactinosynnema sp. L-07]|uniref:hypothetical protein n=1 Tax=Alloactinosynnema sp. L-07 TaxID=1653480 RepID=UPI0006B5D341|nr:hypothetical protein [Alloactinosynnema sp. L-07]
MVGDPPQQVVAGHEVGELDRAQFVSGAAGTTSTRTSGDHLVRAAAQVLVGIASEHLAELHCCVPVAGEHHEHVGYGGVDPVGVVGLVRADGGEC